MEEYIIEPLFDNILVIPEEKPKTTATGIYLPNESGEAPTIGEVIATGEGRFTDSPIPNTVQVSGGVGGSFPPVFAKKPMTIKAGDRVLYKQWGTNSVKMNGKEYFLLKQEDVLAIIRNTKPPETATN